MKLSKKLTTAWRTFVLDNRITKINVHLELIKKVAGEETNFQLAIRIVEQISGLDRFFDIIDRSRDREIFEEVEIVTDNPYDAKLIGYINDETSPVNQVHLGLLHVIETDAEEVIPKDSEIAEGSYKTLEELEEIVRLAADSSSPVSVDKWSAIALEPIRKFFESY